MSIPGRVELERIRRWQGQRLRGREFRDQLAIEAELRWWHHRAAHNVFGVRYGFEVRFFTGASFYSAEVGCGVAYDCYGRELILQTKREIRLPEQPSPPASKMTLIARYKETSEFHGKNNASGSCAGSVEAPDFLWKPASRVQVMDGVPIARLSYESIAELARLPGGLKFPDSLRRKIRYDEKAKRLIFIGSMSNDEKGQLINLSTDTAFMNAVESLYQKAQFVPQPDHTFSAPPARPLARPRMGSGMTHPGHTAWEPWSERVYDPGRALTDIPLGMQVTIDTSAAGFTETPRYFAWLEGSLWDRSNIEFFPAPFAHIDDSYASAKQFRFRIWMPKIVALIGDHERPANKDFKTEFLNFSNSKNLHVCWLGIQCEEDLKCEEIEECQCQTVNED